MQDAQQTGLFRSALCRWLVPGYRLLFPFLRFSLELASPVLLCLFAIDQQLSGPALLARLFGDLSLLSTIRWLPVH